MNAPAKALLEVDQLITSFETDAGMLRAVDHVSFSVNAGQTVGIVGESGCGKSVTAMSIVRLLPQPSGRILGGQVMFNGRDLTHVSHDAMCKVRGKEIGVIFQEPMAALNPVHRIGKQVAEVLRIHQKISNKDAWDQATHLLDLVKIPSPALRMADYPHQLSGGMRQRVVIAMAIACRPQLLIADEPTTALDVTVQAQILELLDNLKQESNMAMLLITHDLGVIAESCDQIVVMYAGRVVERGPVRDVFSNPCHAYTQGLLRSVPKPDVQPKSILPTIPGMVAALKDYTHGCRFCQRLGRTPPRPNERPSLIECRPGHWVENCPLCNLSI
ncbi:MAG: ABC transporter ATP-binding protein [Verrucomicrobia bacterium]|nr:MAG: ABC transporter ATP-binding protein [Verrucomicrobiota bacterium]